jgi:hypothetical protein
VNETKSCPTKKRAASTKPQAAFVEAVRRFGPKRQFVNWIVLLEGLMFYDEGPVPGPVGLDRPLQNQVRVYRTGHGLCSDQGISPDVSYLI